ncbi:class I SAM-dependent methyltransferase [Micromonospora sp. NPDC049089]|uniref:class I SAM-dependent methyltransferase n=1 Tax=Micromonospora sp. NPDC049089 TaxID=3155496 RepID=UPI0033C0FA24
MKLDGIELVRCQLCGRAGGHSPTLGELLWSCPDCGFVWTAGSSATPEDLYDEAYYATGGYQDYFASAGQRRFEASRRLRWLLSTVRPTVLLEAGPAGGYFLEAAHQAGITASGIEVSHTAATFARDHLHMPVRQGYFETIAPTLTADVVCAFHVLEHVEDPRAFLHAAHTALTPGGWLALEVPNIASAAANRLGTDWPGLQSRYHRWHFTPDTLVRMLVESGFRVISHDTVFSRFYWQPAARLRNARDLLVADVAASRSPRVTHPQLGDLLRIFARRDDRAVS